MIGKEDIDPKTRIVLQLAEEELLVRTIWGLSSTQKHTQVFNEIGQQRYLSALRSGGIDNAVMTQTAFRIDPFFVKSKVVMEAAKYGFDLSLALGKLDVAAKIKTVMGLNDQMPPSAVGEADTAQQIA